jgi:hypothetical protein
VNEDAATSPVRTHSESDSSRAPDTHAPHARSLFPPLAPLIALLFLILLASSPHQAQDDGAMAEAPPSIPTDLAVRLEALHPDDPESYFLLAEEVAELVEDLEHLQLARTLFILAFELERKRGGSSALAASAVLGLADVERLERDRHWLRAVAGAIDPGYQLPDWTVAAWPAVSEDVAFKAATAIGLARAGEGRDARRLLAEPGVNNVLLRFERALGATGGAGALSRIERYAEQWPCRECGNARATTRPGQGGLDVRLCPVCQGRPGPRLTAEEFVAQLRFESALLHGIQRSWGAQIMVDGGAVLRDPEPDELAFTYGVDAARPWWRQGQWVAEP